MKTLDRRDFLKKATLAGASALTVPTLFESCTSKASASTVVATDGLESKLIVPKNNGLKITGTFLDEISMIFHIRTGVRKSGTWIFST